MNKLFVVCLLALCFFITSCKKNDNITSDNSNSIENNQILPLSTGNEWIYNYQVTNYPDSLYYEKIYADTLINGVRYFSPQSYRSPLYPNFWLTNTDSGIVSTYAFKSEPLYSFGLY